MAHLTAHVPIAAEIRSVGVATVMFSEKKASAFHKKNMGLGGGLMGKALMAAAKADENYKSPTKPAGMSMLRAAKTVGKDETESLARAVKVKMSKTTAEPRCCGDRRPARLFAGGRRRHRKGPSTDWHQCQRQARRRRPNGAAHATVADSHSYHNPVTDC